MKFKFVVCSKIFMVIILLTNISYTQTTIVKGKLLDVNGNPSRYALVGIAPTEHENGRSFVSCDSNGMYSIKITTPDMNYLLYTIPSHESLRIPLLNDMKKEIHIDVNLATYQYKGDLDDVAAVWPANKMTKLDDGTYMYEGTSDKDTIGYQLWNIHEKGRSVNGLESISYVPDSSGDYISIVTPKDGKFKIVFDPKKLLIKSDPHKVTFNGSYFDKQFYQLLTDFSQKESDCQIKMSAYYRIHNDIKDFSYDDDNYISNLQKEIDTEKDIKLCNLMKLMYVNSASFKTNTYDTVKAKEYFKSIPLEDPIWRIYPRAYTCIYNIYRDPKERAVVEDKFLKKTKSDEIKYYIFQEKLLGAKNETEEKRIRSQIRIALKDSKQWQSSLDRISPDYKIQPGKDIPAFTVTSIDNPSEKYSRQNMKGRIYLVDFWATWCGPCVGEMENLYKVYEKYKNKGFEILSLSIDDNQDAVKSFRKIKWKMPWKNSCIGNNQKMLKDFAVIGVPTPILVSAKGKVLVKNREELHGEKLDETLAKYFK